MSKVKKVSPPAANVGRRPDWTPRKISYPKRYPMSCGGVTYGTMSLPAISMHIAALRDANKAITIHGGDAA